MVNKYRLSALCYVAAQRSKEADSISTLLFETIVMLCDVDL